MKLKISEIEAKSILQKSNLPLSKYCINPYIGCMHGCVYCYARFMRRFTGHGNEEWGEFVDVKVNSSELLVKQLQKMSLKDPVFLGSVTDLYQPIEKRIEALMMLHDAGINTYIFIGPILPHFTDIPMILEKTQNYLDGAMAEILNISCGNWKYIERVLTNHFPQHLTGYKELVKNQEYWKRIEIQFISECKKRNINMLGFFTH